MEKLILGRETAKKEKPVYRELNVTGTEFRPYTSKNTAYDEPIHGCAFSGASSVCTSVKGLTTILHSPRSCAQLTVQLDSKSVKGAYTRGYSTSETFGDPDVICTDMGEGTMVFGGNDLLRRKLEEQISLGKRDFAVITACPPGIIGDDPRGVAATVEKEHPGVKIAVLEEDGNATGDFMQGTLDAGIGLIERFASKGDTRPMTVNLVGVKTMASSACSEL